MNIDKCNYDLETNIVPGCDPCRKWYYNVVNRVRFGDWALIITRKYEVKTCLQGYSGGDLIAAYSLLPGEERELEIIRREKFTQKIHEQHSIESEFEQSFMNTFRFELNASQEFNSEQSAGGGFNFFGLFGGGAEASANQNFQFDQSLFSETVRKSSARVSRKHDISIDLKTERETKFRSLRKISNPNPCKVVSYFFKQLNKKYKLEISLIDVRFDWKRFRQPVFEKALPYYSLNRTLYNPEIRLAENINLRSASTSIVNADLNLDSPESIVNKSNRLVQEGEQEITRYEKRPMFKEHRAEGLIDQMKLKNVRRTVLTKIQDYIKKLKSDPNFKIGVIFEQEYCLRTHHTLAEPKVSECEICDCDGCGSQESEEERKLRLEKLSVEIELLKQQLASR